MRYSIVVFCVLVVNVLSAQVVKPTVAQKKVDSTKPKTIVPNKKPSLKAQDYQFVDFYRDTTFVDTTLSIKKDYKYNYLRKDNFELMQFANIGQTYNSLSLNFKDDRTIPGFAAQARHFNYFNAEDMVYYHVPTPLTELLYKTAFQQGQVLDAFFTVNTSRQFNFSIAYKGLRSLGNYQNALTSTGNFRFTSNYSTKNKRYSARAHIVFQDLLNQENGGIKDEDVEKFVNGNAEFKDRSIFDPNLENAENILKGRRFYLEHDFSIVKSRDSVSKGSLVLNNKVFFEDKYYQYYENTNTETFFGPSFTNSVNDKVTLEHFYTDFGVRYTGSNLGDLEVNVSFTDLNYGYNNIVILDNATISNRITSSFAGLNAHYKKRFKGFSLTAKGETNLSDEFSGYNLDGKLGLVLNNDLDVSAGITINSRLSNFNHLLFQSDYLNYNWDNTADFENVNSQQLYLSLQSDRWFNASFDLTNIDNYTYFNLEGLDEQGIKLIKPKQSSETIQYLRIKVQKEIQFGKFALDNTLMYQNSSSEALNVPAFITRNTFYYTDVIFKKALTFQTGIIFNFFSEYAMNGYDPLLAEFYTQNTQMLGAFPRLDFFINAKVRQTRIFLKAEHFNSSFTGYDYFSAPNNPYRDFVIRFGLVWDFFL